MAKSINSSIGGAASGFWNGINDFFYPQNAKPNKPKPKPDPYSGPYGPPAGPSGPSGPGYHYSSNDGKPAGPYGPSGIIGVKGPKVPPTAQDILAGIYRPKDIPVPGSIDISKYLAENPNNLSKQKLQEIAKLANAQINAQTGPMKAAIANDLAQMLGNVQHANQSYGAFKKENAKDRQVSAAAYNKLIGRVAGMKNIQNAAAANTADVALAHGGSDYMGAGISGAVTEARGEATGDAAAQAASETEAASLNKLAQDDYMVASKQVAGQHRNQYAGKERSDHRMFTRAQMAEIAAIKGQLPMLMRQLKNEEITMNQANNQYKLGLLQMQNSDAWQRYQALQGREDSRYGRDLGEFTLRSQINAANDKATEAKAPSIKQTTKAGIWAFKQLDDDLNTLTEAEIAQGAAKILILGNEMTAEQKNLLKKKKYKEFFDTLPPG